MRSCNKYLGNKLYTNTDRQHCQRFFTNHYSWHVFSYGLCKSLYCMAITKSLILVSDIYRFIVAFFKGAAYPPYEGKEILNQCFVIGYKSLFLITFTCFLAGIVFTKQSQPSLASFGAESWLPSLVSQGVIRSLGPLITGLICAGKLGSNIGAELGSMQVSEQIDEIGRASCRERV